MEIARIKVRFRTGPSSGSFTIPLRRRPGRAPKVVVGTRTEAVAQAIAATRRDDRSWAVLHAGRGRYELVRLWIGPDSDEPHVDKLGRLGSAPGLTYAGIERVDPRLVAIAGSRSAHEFGRRASDAR